MIAIDWKPSRQASLPLYRQIYLFIQGKIRSNQWTAGTLLPPQRELAGKLGVNRSTLTIAIEELVADGYLISRRGSGIKVSGSAWAEITAGSRSWNERLTADAFLSNHPMVQQINELEFAPGMIRLGTGELAPELFPQKVLRKLIAETAPEIDNFGYLEPQGLLSLREELSHHLAQHGIVASPASILIVSGALQALQLICFGLLEPHDAMFIERPSYLLSLKLFRSLQLHFTELPMTRQGLSLPDLIKQQQQHRHALLYTIPTFHNPTGALMPLKTRQSLLQFCQEARLPIIEDDVYRDLWLDQKPPAPLKALDDHGMVLYVSSLSKTIGPGLRIGWIAGPEPIIRRLADLKMQHDYGSSILSQWVAAEWLRRGLETTHLQMLRENLRQRRALTLQCLEKYFSQLGTWNIPAGGFYIWLKLNQPVSMSALFKTACARNILLNPGTIYDQQANQFLRISYAYAKLDELKYGLQQLGKLLQSV